MPDAHADAVPSWPDLRAWAAAPEAEALEALRRDGPTNAQATLRLFGCREAEVRVTLYRDHHAWCPYCQKIWLWLEERQIPYRIRKVTMFCYGTKEAWFTRLVPSGMLPALELDGRLITESDRILAALERAFGPLGPLGFDDPTVQQLRQLERLLFRAWCQWLCTPGLDAAAEQRAQQQLQRFAAAMEQALVAAPGAFLLGEQPATADLVFVPYLERMNASLAYYKGFVLRHQHSGIDRWFQALEQRPTYLGTQSDVHTHAHDLPPQMGGCYASGSPVQQELAARIDRGPWPVATPDPETSAPMAADARQQAVARVVRHAPTLVARMAAASGGEPAAVDTALRLALMSLMTAEPPALPPAPPAGTAPGLRYLRDRISVPRDMGLHAARVLRQVLETTAACDPRDGAAAGPSLPMQHRRDQDPAPFIRAA
ncbi:MAG: glutathione S-transferase family protein [Cyanobacteria bacterium K_DeepCast_35m_m2_023]|nr:glutathione S-transferase family protein [Cyanobacteria bacterium K_DeepCast_35m_m2_023]